MTDQGTSAATAALWESFRGGPVVHCYLCAHHCRVAPGDRGLCGVRENREGVLYTLTYACPISAGIDPIEKKPLFHFLPGSSSFSIATVGCNFVCLFCQNADISQMPRDQGVVRGMHMEPREVVERALAGRCRSISYTYTEPTIYFEFADACARLADAAGLKNVFVTNGYMTRQALEAIDGRLHAANVDLKSFSDDFYRRMVGARLKPVLDSIRRLVAMGVWVEVTTLLIPGENDSEDELRRLAGFLVDLDPNVPWHVSRFHPTYRLRDVPPTPVASVRRAVAIGYEMGLRYVYAGNVPGEPSESTRCPKCGHLVIERRGFMVERMRLDGDRCRDCGTTIPLVLEGKGGTDETLSHWRDQRDEHWSAAMSLVGCFVTPHPPIVVPVVGGRRLGQVAATAEALRALGEQARHLRPDAIALMSPHARLDPGRMGVSTCSRYEGSLAYFGAPEVHVALEGAPGLAQAILSQAAARGVAAAPIPARGGILELDHGSLVPLVYLLEHLDPLPSLVLLSFSDLSAPAHLTFGRAVGAAADGAADRVLYVASGDLSHRLTPDAPAGYNPRAADFDRAVVDALAAGSEEALLGIPPVSSMMRGECGYRSLLTLFGLLSGREFKPRVLSYEGPFGVGYLVAAIELAAPAAAST